MNAVATTDPNDLPLAPAPNESAAILSVIERMAMNPDIDPDRIERFIVLKERMDAKQAKIAFDAAIAEAKAQIKPAEKNRKGHNNKMYADFYAYAKVIDPVLSALGLSYRFRTEQTDRVTVTCILSHRDGNAEENTLSGPPDSSGSKNAIQAIGSTLTYLQRYTLVQALGLAASEDDDAERHGTSIEDNTAISEEQRQEIADLIDETGSNIDIFCRYYKIPSIKDMPVSKFAGARQALMKKRGAAQ